MSLDRQPSCEDPFDALMPVDEARSRLLARLVPVDGEEYVPLSDAVGRTLALALESPVDVPPENNSAMDGYAIDARAIPAAGEARLRLAGIAWAGRPFDGTAGEGEAVRIFTGAIMPPGTDTVVIQERAVEDDGHVCIDASAEPGRNVRAAGEDVRAGEALFAAGRRLGPADIGVLASLGIDAVRVKRKVAVAFFTTGDELVSLDDRTPLAPGQLYDSNRHLLRVLLAAAGVDPIDLGIVADSAEATRTALLEAASRADLIVTSGGVSAGDADFVTRVFHEIGDVEFWKLAMRPGRPLAFGRLGDATFLGLPGNPVAVMVTFLQFVQPAIRRLSGAAVTDPFTAPARSLSRLRKSPGRTEFQRGIARLDESGELVVESTGPQGAGRLSSMAAANCLIVIAPEIESVAPGDRVMVQPLEGLLP